MHQSWLQKVRVNNIGFINFPSLVILLSPVSNCHQFYFDFFLPFDFLLFFLILLVVLPLAEKGAGVFSEVTPELTCGTTEHRGVPKDGVHPVFPMASCHSRRLNKLRQFFFYTKYFPPLLYFQNIVLPSYRRQGNVNVKHSLLFKWAHYTTTW